ncbi:MAG: ketopantoate reductase C-terminal domain-containing protein [Comamonadaceae bacterium]
MAKPEILVIGAGAVGTTLAAYLTAAGQRVGLLIRETDQTKFESVPFLTVDRIAGAPALTTQKPELSTEIDLTAVAYLFICVKHAALEQVLSRLPSTLPSQTTLVSTLNGISALPHLKRRYPAGQVANMTVMFNAQLVSPLHSRMTTKPQIVIDSADSRLPGLFDHSGMQVKHTHGEAIAWGKLLLNLANAVCALTHTTAKDLLTVPDLRAIYAAVLDEAVAVIERAGVPYQLPLPLPYRLFRQIILHGGPLPWWIASLRNGLQQGSYPSMVADIEAGRPTEVNQLNGEIVSLGRAQALATPINARMVELVQAIEGHLPARYMSPLELRAQLESYIGLQ